MARMAVPARRPRPVAADPRPAAPASARAALAALPGGTRLLAHVQDAWSVLALTAGPEQAASDLTSAIPDPADRQHVLELMEQQLGMARPAGGFYTATRPAAMTSA